MEEFRDHPHQEEIHAGVGGFRVLSNQVYGVCFCSTWLVSISVDFNVSFTNKTCDIKTNSNIIRWENDKIEFDLVQFHLSHLV